MDSEPSASGVARRAAVAVLALVAVVAGGVGIGLTAVPARAATAHRAAVVVYVNGAVHTAKITFTSDSISGIDALNDAGFAPLVRVFGGNGGAVCALDVGGTTIGCPADNSCLTCSEASDYWAYFRALAGETSYTYSRAGAGSTQVRDGGVEAWAWGTGVTPTPFVSFASVWGSSDPPTTRPTTPPTGPTNPTKPTAPKSSPSTVAALGPAPTVVTPPVPPSSGAIDPATATTVKSSTTKPPGSDASAPPTSTARAADASGARRVATAPIVDRHNGGSPFGIIGFAVILALLVAAIVFARRRRSAAPHAPT